MRTDPPQATLAPRRSERAKPSRGRSQTGTRATAKDETARGSKPEGGAGRRETRAEQVQARYRENAARHLIGIARDFQNRAMRHLADECGYTDLRPSLGPLLSLVAIEARPPGALASQLAISPQACSQLVNLAEGAGYLERRPDPSDRRTRLVVLTDRGRALVAEAVVILRSVESDYRELVGAKAWSKLTGALGVLFRGLGLPIHSDAGLASGASGSLGVLPLVSLRIQQDLMAATAARGHAGLKMSHAQVLPLIGAEGARVNELARVQRVSRQAISATARDLERLGHLERAADPRDRRGVVFRLTPKGQGLIEDSVAALDALDETLLALLGEKGLRGLQAAARELYQALHLEEEIFETRAGPGAGVGAEVDGGPPGLELERLAASLRRQLGARDAERLAALLASGS